MTITTSAIPEQLRQLNHMWPNYPVPAHPIKIDYKKTIEDVLINLKINLV